MKANEYLPTLNWQDTMPTNPTALRVIAKDGEKGLIGAYNQLDILIKARAPEDQSLVNKKAVNSFAYGSRQAGNALEPNSVYNQMDYPNGNLILNKYSDKRDESGNKIPLAGAEFTLFRQDGTIVAKATSDDKGKVEFKDVKIGNYSLEETKTPEGHTGQYRKAIN
ncbi:MSCRAMM family protein, partial [Histophilus somni]|uniref:MSCRAMM family protein n=1 Tax=Histophilus somni TaxID=731 RepID=UPI00201F9F9A